MLALLALLLLCLVVVGSVAVSTALELQADARRVEQAVADGDYPGAAEALAGARSQAARLDGLLSSAPLSWTGRVPVIGPTVTAGRELVSATDTVLAATAPLGTSLGTVADDDPMTALASLQAAGAELRFTSQAAASASRQVAAVDPGSVLAPLQGRFRSARSQLVGAYEGAAQGSATASVLPSLLGVGEPARWLVLLAQPAEARGSGGGFYGAYLTLTATDGRFELGESASNDAQMKVARDLSSMPPEYRRLWGEDAEYVWGFNLSRHYPYAATVAREALDPSADFVVSLDPRTVARLLAIAGPVTVDGVTIDADNAEAFFTRDIYVRYPDPEMKDRATLQALQAVFAGLGSVGAATPEQWLAALADPVMAGHVQVWSPDAELASVLQASALGGAVPDDPAPWATVAFNNAGGNKIDSYVSTAVEYAVSGDCSAQSVSGTLTTQLSIDQIPRGLPPYISGRADVADAPYGTTAMLVHLYGPVGARGAGPVLVNGDPVPAVFGTERGHPVWGVKVQLAPGAPVTVQVPFTQPPYPGQPLVVAPQPMVRDTGVSVADRRSCAIPAAV